MAGRTKGVGKRPLVTVLLATAVGLSGCGSDDATRVGAATTSAGSAVVPPSEAAPAAASALPQLDATTVGFPAALESYERVVQSTEESLNTRFGGYALPSEDYPTLLLGVTPGTTLDRPDPLDELVDTKEVDGFLCGSDRVFDMACRGPLKGGIFSISLTQEALYLGQWQTPEELVALGTAFYEAASTGDNTAREPCEMVSVSAVEEVLGSFLDGGTLVIDEEYSWVEARQAVCSLILPEGSFDAGSGALVDQGSPGTLRIDRYSYDDGHQANYVDCSYGGYSRADVFTSARDCLAALAAGSATDTTIRPNGDGGVVTDGQISAVVAADGPYWFEISLSGIQGSMEYDRALLGVARLLEGD